MAATNDNTEKVVWLFEAQNKDVLRKLNQIERQTKGSFQKSAKHVKSFNLQMQKSAMLAKGFAASMASFGGVAVIGGLTGIASAFRSVVAEASQLAKTADLVGVSVENLQRMQYGFGLAGVSVANTEKSLEQFGKRLTEAEMKGGYLAKILAANTIALRDQDGKMRPLVELLGDYAELISRAGSEQEKLALANEAFGRSGSTMVLALRNGRKGMRELMSAADDAGGVLEEKVLRRAEQIDDEFARLSRTIGVNLKTAILDMSTDLTVLLGMFRDLDRRTESNIRQEIEHLEERMAQWDGIDLFGVGDRERRDLLRRELMRRALENGPTDIPGRAAWLGQEEEVASNDPPTIIPSKPGNGKGKPAASALEGNAVRERIAALQAEYEAIGQTALQQRIMNELRSVGANATEAQKKQISELVTEIEAAKSKQEAWNHIQQQTEQLAMNSFGQLTSQIKTGNDALDQFLQTMFKVSMQAAVFGTGPLAGLFGGGLSSLFGGSGAGAAASGGLQFGGLYAKGGYLGAGEWGIAGENGPEPIVGPARVIPNHRMNEVTGQASGDPVAMHLHVHGVRDVDGFKRSQSQIGANLNQMLAVGRRNM